MTYLSVENGWVCVEFSFLKEMFYYIHNLYTAYDNNMYIHAKYINRTSGEGKNARNDANC